jgi:hypothetical protein
MYVPAVPATVVLMTLVALLVTETFALAMPPEASVTVPSMLEGVLRCRLRSRPNSRAHH